MNGRDNQGTDDDVVCTLWEIMSGELEHSKFGEQGSIACLDVQQVVRHEHASEVNGIQLLIVLERAFVVL